MKLQSKDTLLKDRIQAKQQCIITNKTLKQALAIYEKAQSSHAKNIIIYESIDTALAKIDGRTKIIPSRAQARKKEDKTLIELTKLLSSIEPKKRATIVARYKIIQADKINKEK